MSDPSPEQRSGTSGEPAPLPVRDEAVADTVADPAALEEEGPPTDANALEGSDSRPAPVEPRHPMESYPESPVPGPPDQVTAAIPGAASAEATEPAAPVEAAATEPAAPVKAAEPEPAAPVEAAATEPAAPVEAAEPEPAAPVEAAATEPAAPVEAAEPEPAAPVEAAEPEPAAPVEAAEPEPAEAVEAAAPARRQAMARWAMVVLPLLTIAVVTGVFFLNRDKEQPKERPVPKGFVAFEDKPAGFSMFIPSGWKQEIRPRGDLRAVISNGKLDSVLVRVVPTAVPITADNLADVKGLTDSLVKKEGVKVLEEKAVALNGMPGFWYLYTFKDDSGVEGLHAHYFLFQGKKINMLVFQAMPTENFRALAQTFDTMAESFVSSPQPAKFTVPTTPAPPSSPPSSGEAPSTTAPAPSR